MTSKQARVPGPIEDAREYAFEQWVRLWLRRRIAEHAPGDDDGILALLEDGLRPESSGSFAFPAQDIADAASPDGKTAHLRLHFLGLTGASSPLPSFLVEDLARERESSSSWRDFLHLFERRAYRLYAWVVLQRKTWARAEFGTCDALVERLTAWAGDTGTGPGMDVARRLRGMALLGPSVRSAVRLRRYLSLQLSEEAIEVDDRGEQWLANPSPAGLGRAVLGCDAAIGGRIRLAGERVQVRVGPMDWDDYQQYAGDRAGTQARVAGLMDHFLERPRPWQVAFELDAATAPRSTTILGGQMRLGRHAWIGSSSRRLARLVIASSPDPTGQTS